MPVYEFQCKKCGKEFSVAMTVKEKEAKKVRCPECKSLRAQQVFSSFVANTSKKS